MKRPTTPRLHKLLTPALLLSSLCLLTPMAVAGTVTYGGPGTLSAGGSWVGGVRPVTTDEALFTGALPVAVTTASGTNLEFGDFLWNSASSSEVALNTTATTGATTQLRLSGLAGSTSAVANGGSAGDLILMGTNAAANTLKISPNIGTGTNVLQVRLQASGNFNVVNSGATLNILSRITDNNEGWAVTKTGAGTLILGGTNTIPNVTVSSGVGIINGTLTNSGAVTVATMATLGGAGSIVGAVNVATGGLLAPGTTPAAVGTLSTGILTVSGNYLPTLTGNGINDRLNITGDVNFTGGTVSPALAGGYSPVLNDAFNLADWTGAFSGVPAFDFSNAALSPGLTWDTSTFVSDGRLVVVAVPEPAAALLGGCGLMVLFRRRRADASVAVA